jgi:hypothetical protein
MDHYQQQLQEPRIYYQRLVCLSHKIDMNSLHGTKSELDLLLHHYKSHGQIEIESIP